MSTSNIFVALLLSFTAAVILMPFVRFVLQKLGFWNALDKERKKPVVRGGGIAVAAAFLLSGYLWYFFAGSPAARTLNGFVPAMLIMLVTGVIDDRFGIRALPKLMLQLVAIAFLWFFGYRINTLFGWELPWMISLGLTLFWGVSILNAFNLIDGMDGLCTGNAMIAAGALQCMAIVSGYSPVPVGPFLLIGCCAGFLIYNFYPAKLFLGDTGSLFLGLTCATLSLEISRGHFNVHNLAAFLMVFWIPFCDVGLAVWRRKVKSLLKNSGCEIMERDLYHLHYRLQNILHNHRLTVLVMWCGMTLIDLFAIPVFRKQSPAFTAVIFTILCVFSLAVLAQYELRYTCCLVKHTVQRLRIREGRQRLPLFRKSDSQ